MRVGDLEVVAEHPVEADLERRDAGALALALLQRRDVLPAAVAQLAQLVELRVVARLDHAALGERGGRPLRQRACQHVGHVAQQVELIERGGERGAPALRSPGQRGERLEHIGQPEEGIPQGAELPRRRATGGGPAGQPLEVAHAVERLAHAGAAAAVAQAGIDGVEPGLDRRHVAERREHPLAEQPAAHRRERAVDRLQQRGVPGTGHERLDQLQVAAGHLVEPEVRVAAAHGGARQVRHAAGLQLGEVAEQRTRRAQGRRVLRR